MMGAADFIQEVSLGVTADADESSLPEGIHDEREHLHGLD